MKSKTIYGEEAFLALNIFSIKTKNKLVYNLIRISAVLVILGGIYMLTNVDYVLKGMIYIVLGTIFYLFIIAAPKLKLKRYLNDNNEIVDEEYIITLGEKVFEVESKDQEANIAYEDIYKIYETQKYYFVYTTSRTAFPISKEGITGCTKEEFSKVLKEKVGKKFSDKYILD